MNAHLLFIATLSFLTLSTSNSIVVRQNGCAIDSICYVLDQSGSINNIEYGQQQDFVIAVANQVLNESSISTISSAVAFSNVAQVIQTPTSNINEFVAAIRSPRIFRQGTIISAGLRVCKSQLDSGTGNRVIVLLTDGEGDSAPSIQVANAAKESGINIVTVGIGPFVSEDFLRGIATRPEFFIKANFSTLDRDVFRLVQAICDVPNSTPDKDACENAFDECQFAFAGESGLSTFDVSGEPDIPFTPKIVPKNVMMALGVLNTNNIIPEFIDNAGSAMPVTEFGTQRFTPTVFKPFWKPQERGSGIGHETFQGNQEEIAMGRCVRVFFTSFQEIQQFRVVNRNNVPRSENKCVVFRTK